MFQFKCATFRKLPFLERYPKKISEPLFLGAAYPQEKPFSRANLPSAIDAFLVCILVYRRYIYGRVICFSLWEIRRFNMGVKQITLPYIRHLYMVGVCVSV